MSIGFPPPTPSDGNTTKATNANSDATTVCAQTALLVNLRYLVPVRRVVDPERMKPEDRCQRLLGLLVARRHVDPDQTIGPAQ